MLKENDELNNRILETALSLFNEHGIEHVSMHKIAKTAEVGQATLYRRYANKSKLCIALMEKKFSRHQLELQTYLKNKRDQPVYERLLYLLVQLNLIVGEHLDWMRMLTTSGTLEETSRDVYSTCYYKKNHQLIYELLEEAKSKGETNITDIRLTSFMLASPISPELMFYLHDMGYSLREIAENFAKIQLDPLFAENGGTALRI
ncbi:MULTISPECIES: TetR/AcrR family transcriptional regulator [Bacillus]|uniref:TetR/AcrR family transcriptional regulator n=2 Tax=Bacillus TaxID=1386 RepID=A0AAJ4D2V9_9BACI|nr:MULTISPECIES: TetR/AcrR family transcriptional regulator [Bacillus]KKB72075.1 hypothetical protein TH62_19355 [Bacillus sp. TH008]MDU0069777.1 TetR/AcrR family transcriptional regulator [Bacillus sp. IG6]MED8018063.1 TetR/AcrR family transcriptional regulator [Bacillus glycinifermentans]QAT65366.1 TetR/AcrR family transcriptional regulator [Bacillus glycinifermentans]WKB79366.1 TetR/AcrR family transcriptional regulator [Bacillus glycinifermentans]